MDWKNQFAEIIKQKLELEWSPEKTKVLDLRKYTKVKFLGYSLARQKKRKATDLVNVGIYTKSRTDILNRTKVKKEKITQTKITYKTTAANSALITGIDFDRVLD